MVADKLRQIANSLCFAVGNGFIKGDIVLRQKFSVEKLGSHHAKNTAEHFYIVPVVTVDDEFFFS